jgi:hypothetical protein
MIISTGSSPGGGGAKDLITEVQTSAAVGREGGASGVGEASGAGGASGVGGGSEAGGFAASFASGDSFFSASGDSFFFASLNQCREYLRAKRAGRKS